MASVILSKVLFPFHSYLLIHFIFPDSCLYASCKYQSPSGKDIFPLKICQSPYCLKDSGFACIQFEGHSFSHFEAIDHNPSGGDLIYDLLSIKNST